MSCGKWTLFLAPLLACTAAVRGQGDAHTPRIEIYHPLWQDEFTGQPGSLFGYSIAYQKVINKLIVGSPKEDSIGQVYLCPTDVSSNCTHVTRAEEKIVYDTRNASFWLGARVDAGPSFYMACAPRYLEKLSDEPVGTGFISTKGRCYYVETSASSPQNFTAMTEITDQAKKDYHEATHRKDLNSDDEFKSESRSDSFGWSSHVVEKATYVGGPVMSIGRVFKNENGVSVLMPVDNNKLLEGNKAISINFGYSITSGYFLENGPLLIAISTPYGTIGHGRVHFYEKESNDVLEMWVDGEEVAEVGSLFGACLATLERGNGSAALIVGAPAFKEYQSPGYDIGAVFVYTFLRTTDTSELLEITNTVLVKKLVPRKDDEGGRFGASIVSVGDFDDDGISEVAIAAPLWNNGRGAVYIYSGKMLLGGLHESRVEPMQILLPKEDRRGYYGWSLTALEDADQNGCNELAIGAPDTDSVTLFHCIASLQAKFVNIEVKDDLEDKAKDIVKGSNTSFKYEPCLQVAYGDKPDPATIKTTIIFSIEIIHPSAILKSGENNGTMRVFPDSLRFETTNSTKNFCHPVEVLLPQDGDYDQKITFNLSVKVNENPLERKFDPKLVLLNDKTYESQLTTIDTVLPGSNVTFEIETTAKNNYTIGSTNKEKLTIVMTNSGNVVAHGACVRTRLADDVTVSEMPRSACTVADKELICRVEKLQRANIRKIEVTLSMTSLSSSSKEKLEFISESFTSNCLIATNKSHTTTISLRKDTNIEIKSDSFSNTSVSQQELDSDGKNIDHKYTIINHGVTLWKNLMCEITLPSQVKIEKVTAASQTCQIIDNKSYCNITRLAKNLPIDVMIQMKIERASSFANQIKKGKETVDTSLTLVLSDEIHIDWEMTTIVTLREAQPVPMWMTVVAVLVGILIVIVLMWVLRECGCMQRQNKQKLRVLKKEVQRQSVRRSIMLRQSLIEVIPNKVDNNEREKLINIAEEEPVTPNEEKYHAPGADHRTSVGTSKDVHVNTKQMGNTSIELHAMNEQQTKDIENGEPKDTDTVNEKPKGVDEQQVGAMANAHPVKEIHFDEKDPARVAFNAELAKALAKGGNTCKVLTEAEMH